MNRTRPNQDRINVRFKYLNPKTSYFRVLKKSEEWLIDVTERNWNSTKKTKWSLFLCSQVNPIQENAVIPYKVIIDSDGMETAVLGLRFRVTGRHFRNGKMHLTCTASISKIRHNASTSQNISNSDGDSPKQRPLESRPSASKSGLAAVAAAKINSGRDWILCFCVSPDGSERFLDVTKAMASHLQSVAVDFPPHVGRPFAVRPLKRIDDFPTSRHQRRTHLWIPQLFAQFFFGWKKVAMRVYGERSVSFTGSSLFLSFSCIPWFVSFAHRTVTNVTITLLYHTTKDPINSHFVLCIPPQSFSMVDWSLFPMGTRAPFTRMCAAVLWANMIGSPFESSSFQCCTFKTDRLLKLSVNQPLVCKLLPSQSSNGPKCPLYLVQFADRDFISVVKALVCPSPPFLLYSLSLSLSLSLTLPPPLSLR